MALDYSSLLRALHEIPIIHIWTTSHRFTQLLFIQSTDFGQCKWVYWTVTFTRVQLRTGWALRVLNSSHIYMSLCVCGRCVWDKCRNICEYLLLASVILLECKYYMEWVWCAFWGCIEKCNALYGFDVDPFRKEFAAAELFAGFPIRDLDMVRLELCMTIEQMHLKFFYWAYGKRFRESRWVCVYVCECMCVCAKFTLNEYTRDQSFALAKRNQS